MRVCVCVYVHVVCKACLRIVCLDPRQPPAFATVVVELGACKASVLCKRQAENLQAYNVSMHAHLYVTNSIYT